MKFIEVTEFVDDKPMLINLEHITDIISDACGTRIYFSTGGEDWIQINETYDEIKGIIRQAQAEQEGRI